jgi:hypothetical protein
MLRRVWANSGLVVYIDSGTVRPTVGYRFGHPGKEVDGNRSRSTEVYDACDSAHNSDLFSERWVRGFLDDQGLTSVQTRPIRSFKPVMSRLNFHNLFAASTSREVEDDNTSLLRKKYFPEIPSTAGEDAR